MVVIVVVEEAYPFASGDRETMRSLIMTPILIVRTVLKGRLRKLLRKTSNFAM
jgi:hypothetical protein